MLWLKRHEPEVFDKTSYYMGAVTFLVYRLTGSFVADYGCYKLAGLPFSIKEFGWDERVCRECGVRKEQLPELKFATELGGTITEEAAKLTGLVQGTPVAVGTGDFLAETLSYGTNFTGLPPRSVMVPVLAWITEMIMLQFCFRISIRLPVCLQFRGAPCQTAVLS